MPKKTYQRNSARRLIDGLAGITTRLGIGSRMGVLTTRGRTSGEPRSTPVDLIRLDGRLHVVGIYGAVAWVHNLRAEPRCSVRHGRRETSYHARELTPVEGAPILREYLRTSSVVLDYQDVGPEAPAAAMESAAAVRPVFRLRPLSED